MNTTTSHESRQARRWRERHHATRPAPAPRTPYLLLCRCEVADGAGFWAMADVETPVDGAAVARERQAVPRDILRETPRCDLVANTPEALQAWGAATLKRRAAARRLGEVLR